MTDSERLDWLETLFREASAGVVLRFVNDDEVEVQEANDETPTPGFCIDINGCRPLDVNAPSLREAIDMMKFKMDSGDFAIEDD